LDIGLISRQGDCRQDADNGDYNHQFDQCESTLPSVARGSYEVMVIAVHSKNLIVSSPLLIHMDKPIRMIYGRVRDGIVWPLSLSR
jgi:hypothetical protein